MKKPKFDGAAFARSSTRTGSHKCRTCTCYPEVAKAIRAALHVWAHDDEVGTVNFQALHRALSKAFPKYPVAYRTMHAHIVRCEIDTLEAIRNRGRV